MRKNSASVYDCIHCSRTPLECRLANAYTPCPAFSSFRHAERVELVIVVIGLLLSGLLEFFIH